MREELLKLKEKLDNIAGNWNGDESGTPEDRAHAAVEGIDHIEGLILILGELNID